MEVSILKVAPCISQFFATRECLLWITMDISISAMMMLGTASITVCITSTQSLDVFIVLEHVEGVPQPLQRHWKDALLQLCQRLLSLQKRGMDALKDLSATKSSRGRPFNRDQ